MNNLLAGRANRGDVKPLDVIEPIAIRIGQLLLPILCLICQDCLGQQPSTSFQPVYVPRWQWSGNLIVVPCIIESRNLESPAIETRDATPSNHQPADPQVSETKGDQKQIAEALAAIEATRRVSGRTVVVWDVEDMLGWLEQPASNDVGVREAIVFLSETAWIERLLAMPAERRSQVAIEICRMLESGVTLCVVGQCEWLGSLTTNGNVGGPALGVVDGCVLNGLIEPAGGQGLIEVTLPKQAIGVWTKRTFQNLSQQTVELRLPATSSYPESSSIKIKPMQSIDWTQVVRTWHERKGMRYPDGQWRSHQLQTGSLVMGGGGGMPIEVWRKFVELAGGAESRIVVLPTAVEQPDVEPTLEIQMLRHAGAENIRILDTIDRDGVESAEFLRSLDNATGLWFGGGRQWRFVDAYWGTAAWNSIAGVLQRGGVIGGSSAGATIQGDLLVRGAPQGNHIMIADGYRRGLGLIPNIAIDQHFSQRNRFAQLEECLEQHPEIFGIGIDENTALIVEKSNRCTVLGNGSVWCYPSFQKSKDFEQAVPLRSSARQQYKANAVFELP